MAENYHAYETLSEAVNDLVRRGYTTDFNIHAEGHCLICTHSDEQLSPDDFEIDETYRFEGDTDPGDEMIVFAISDRSGEMKGVLVNAYGMYADAATTRMVERLQQHL
jgi:hypothetical protein